ncbi:Hpt domain-containing protein [Marinibaculum pumilum]|uniref:Hpt domain-containing protein n=1 Tax=Marinibaculum pumilum TaxID=1766165 RepID=A0ABV7LAB5_9PROT
MATIPQKNGKTDAGRTGNGEKGGKVEIIHPPNLLKMKVGSGGVDPDRIAKAEAAVAELAESYIDWALKDLAELQARLAAIRAETADRRQRVLDLFQTAHDMKGQGATFGYPLVTQVAKHLCHYIEGQLEREQLPDLTIVSAHVDALAAILRGRVAGDGGATGAALVRELEELVRRKLK